MRITSELSFKLLFLGNSNVGKTSLFSRYLDNIYDASYIATLGVDFKYKTINLDGKSIKLNIWDTAGQEKFKTIISTYYKGAHGVIFVFDITDLTSYQGVDSWIEEVKKYAPFDRICKILIGTKSDLTSQRKVSTEQGKELSQRYGMTYYECSAKTGDNVKQAVESLTKEVLAKYGNKNTPQGKPSVSLKPSQKIDTQDKKKGYICDAGVAKAATVIYTDIIHANNQ